MYNVYRNADLFAGNKYSLPLFLNPIYVYSREEEKK
jgi:hypothetical protein